MTAMHAASLDRSDRLRRVFALLADGREWSTRDLVRAADVCAVNSIVSELRANGATITTRWTRSASGARVCLYRLELRHG